MIEIQAVCVCDFCGKKEKAVGAPEQLRPEYAISDHYWWRPDGWQWVQDNQYLMCYECLKPVLEVFRESFKKMR